MFFKNFGFLLNNFFLLNNLRATNWTVGRKLNYTRIRGALGVTDKAAEEAEKAIDPDGGYTFSLSQIIETKQVERTARR